MLNQELTRDLLNDARAIFSLGILYGSSGSDTTLADAKSHYAHMETLLGLRVSYAIEAPYQTFPDDEEDDGRVYTSTDEIRAANLKAGRYWFTPGAMHTFDSRVYGSVHYGRYFISSERIDKDPRRYTVRYADHQGNIETVFGQPEGKFSTYVAAARWLDEQIASNRQPKWAEGIEDARKVARG